MIETSFETTDELCDMYELAYFKDSKDYEEVKQLITDRFPESKISDASDDVHRHTFSIEMSDIDKDIFFIFSLKNKFASCLLSLNLMAMQEGKKVERLIKIANSNKNEIKKKLT